MKIHLRIEMQSAAETETKPPKSQVKMAVNTSYTNIFKLPADKGNAIVMMDKLENSEKPTILIQDNRYCKLNKALLIATNQI